MALEKDMNFNLTNDDIDNNDGKSENNSNDNDKNKNINSNDEDNKNNKNSDNYSQSKFSLLESINMARKRKKEKRKREMFCLETACLLMEASYQAYFPLPINFAPEIHKKEDKNIENRELIDIDIDIDIDKEKEIEKEKEKNIELKKDRCLSETTTNCEKGVTEYSSGIDISRRLIATAVQSLSTSPLTTPYIRSPNRNKTADLISTSGPAAGTGTKFQEAESRDEDIFSADLLFPFLQFPSTIMDNNLRTSKNEDKCSRTADESKKNNETIGNIDDMDDWNERKVGILTSDIVVPDTRTVTANSDDFNDQNVEVTFSKLESTSILVSVSSSPPMPVTFNETLSTDISRALSTPISLSVASNSVPEPIVKSEIPNPLGGIKSTTRMDSTRTFGPKMDLPRMGLKLLSSFENKDHSTFGFVATTPSAPIYKSLLGPIRGQSIKCSLQITFITLYDHSHCLREIV